MKKETSLLLYPPIMYPSTGPSLLIPQIQQNRKKFKMNTSEHTSENKDYHQTNQIFNSALEKYEKQNKDGWKHKTRSDIGKRLELLERNLLDSLITKKGYYAGLNGYWNKEQVTIALSVVSEILNLVGNNNTGGWYCVNCGFLHPEQVTFEERCNICGSLLC